MRGMWLLCLCVFLLAQPPETAIIDSFDTEGTWDSVASEGCNIRTYVDRLNTKEGQASLRLEAQFTGDCEQLKCYAGITREAPDLSGFAFLRLWTRAEMSGNFLIGIHVGLTGGREGIHVVPTTTTWHLETIPFSEFRSEDEEIVPVTPEDIEFISLFIAANEPTTVKVNVDGLVALTDLNDNGVPDADERSIIDAAINSERVANDYFAEEDYEKAEKYFEEARNLYQQVGDQEKAREMDSRSKESRAWMDYQKAEDSYQKEQYTQAMADYERARRGFVVVGNRDMIDLIEDRLEELGELTGKPVTPLSERPPTKTLRPRDQRGGAAGLFLVLILVCLVGVGVYFWKFRGAPKAEKKEKKEPLLPSEAKAEEVRKLKAKFVYGEINRKEYERRLRELEEKS